MWGHTKYLNSLERNDCQIFVYGLYRHVKVLLLLQKLEPDIPEYSSLNVRMRGYDLVILESYAKYVHRLADSLGLDCHAYVLLQNLCVDQELQNIYAFVHSDV